MKGQFLARNIEHNKHWSNITCSFINRTQGCVHMGLKFSQSINQSINQSFVQSVSHKIRAWINKWSSDLLRCLLSLFNRL